MSYFGIGIYKPKFNENIGTLWRSAYLLGAAFIFIIKNKHFKYSTDTPKTWRQIPCYEWNEIILPIDSQLIGIEMDNQFSKIVELPKFSHPKIALYILGNESYGLPKEILSLCTSCISIPCAKKQSYNVSSAGTLVMYDRFIKLNKKGD